MKRIVVFALVLNAALLGVIAHQLVAIAGGGAVAEINGDTNGDGQRDISDATYYLRWLFQGGAEPVEIVCPVDQSDRVAELEAQLAAARDQLAGAEAQLAAANAENAAQAEQMTALQGQLAAANAENAALVDQNAEVEGILDTCRTEITRVQADLVEATQTIAECQESVELECIRGLSAMTSPFLQGQLPAQAQCDRFEAQARLDPRPFMMCHHDRCLNDQGCRDVFTRIEARSPHNVRRMAEVTRMLEQEELPVEIFMMELGHFFAIHGPDAEEWISWCELECPE